MATWATWFSTLTIFACGLAGCVKPYPDEYELPACDPECCDDCGRGWCEGFTSACPQPPATPPAPTPTPWYPPACPEYANFSWPMEPSCAYPDPPLLASFVAQRLADGCDACRNVSIASDGERLLVATEAYLLVVDAGGVSSIPWPSGPLVAPHVQADAYGLAWIAGLDTSLPAPRVQLAAFDGADLAHVATLDALAAPPLLLAERAYVTPFSDGALVVLDTGDAAWSVRYQHGAFSTLERVTPLGGEALVGAPVVDERGRVMLPYAFLLRDALQTAAGTLVPVASHVSLHYASLAEASAGWTTHGGMVVPHGASSAPSIEPGPSGPAAFAWVDASGALQRIASWDEGVSWGAPGRWSDARARASGEPSAALSNGRPTTAWWESASDGAHLVVARAYGETPEAREVAARLPEAGASAALVHLRDGSAVVAWVDGEGGVWAGFEGGAFPARATCDDTAHCAPHALRW